MRATLWPNKLGYDIDGKHEVWIFPDGLGVRTWCDRLGYFTRTAWIPDATVKPADAVMACLGRGKSTEDVQGMVGQSDLAVREFITISSVQMSLVT